MFGQEPGADAHSHKTGRDLRRFALRWSRNAHLRFTTRPGGVTSPMARMRAPLSRPSPLAFSFSSTSVVPPAIVPETDFRELWTKARTAKDEKVAVRTMAEILRRQEVYLFFGISGCGILLCINPGPREIASAVSLPRCSLTNAVIQGIAEHDLRASEKQAFFNTLRRLAGKHVRLPNWIVIPDKIDDSRSGQLRTSGGFADIRQGQYRGFTVAVRTLRVQKNG